HADYDHELRVGSYLKTPESRLYGLREPDTYLTMDQTISSGTGASWRHRLYRGWVEAQAGGVTARFGRQRVAWGTGKIWNPVDVLNPYQPTALEGDERQGLDALTLRRGVGATGQVEAVWGLAGSWAGTDLMGRVRGNVDDADLALMGGKVAGSTGSWLAGGEAAWDLWGGSLHGELSYSALKTRTPFWRFMGGYEYSFSEAPPFHFLKDVWVDAEYFHNGRGRADPARYDFSLLLSGREVAVGQDYAGVTAKKDLTPLLTAQATWLQNIRDGSQFLCPSLDWNALNNLHLVGGWQRLGGGRRSEYGRYPNVAYAQAQYYF
ncbi:MAG: hypothetical protein KGL53_04785, partial [Elusimicrobia bacterium]|nr:hypothetical protein [Elusimicrobiota bacterium]